MEIIQPGFWNLAQFFTICETCKTMQVNLSKSQSPHLWNGDKVVLSTRIYRVSIVCHMLSFVHYYISTFQEPYIPAPFLLLGWSRILLFWCFFWSKGKCTVFFGYCVLNYPTALTKTTQCSWVIFSGCSLPQSQIPLSFHQSCWAARAPHNHDVQWANHSSPYVLS